MEMDYTQYTPAPGTEYRLIEESDLAGVLHICAEEGWHSYTEDRQTAWHVFTAPGVHTIVARKEHGVVGFCQMQSDGVIQAHLSLIAVAREHRRQGIGRYLLAKAFQASGGKRVDLVTETAEGFYASFKGYRLPGFRIYPDE